MVTFANACFSGGGIYLYHGALDNGKFFLASDDLGIALFDVLPDFDYDMDFFDAHVLGYIEDNTEEYNSLFASIFSWIIENKPDGNYNPEELKARKTNRSYLESVSHDLLMGRSIDSAMQLN